MGYCVAGIDRRTGEWVRVVSSNAYTEHAVPESGIICDNGQAADIYDIVEIDFIRAVPTAVQPENYLYNENVKWIKKGYSNLREVVNIHGYDNPAYVFGNTDHRLEEQEVRLAGQSLLLLNVEEPVYNVKIFPERRILQLNFNYNGNGYTFFRVTRKDLKDRYIDEGWYPADTDKFVFSLTDRYADNRYYKVVAQALLA
jgi:hypothetical protein